MPRLTITGLLICIIILAFVAPPFAQQQTIADEQAAWESLGVEAYHIAFQEATTWNMLYLDLWVQDGRPQMLHASCQPGLVGSPCYLGTISPRQYTVGGLFEQAGERLARIEYDHTYHYPSFMYFDNTQAIDDERALRVTGFEVLPEAIPGGYATAVAEATLTSEAPPTVTPAASQAIPTVTSAATPHVIPLSPVAPRGDLDTWLDDADARWNALAVDSYRLTLSETTPWNGHDLTLEVRDGRPTVLEASCHSGWMRGPCDVWAVDTHSYTIPGLLERLRQAVLVDNDRLDAQSVDMDTGIPIRIFYDDPDYYDEEWEIVVSRVVLLEA